MSMSPRARNAHTEPDLAKPGAPSSCPSQPVGPAWEAPVFDRELLRKYDRSGPRYTSYPTANLFHEGFSGSDYEALLHGSDREAPERPLSLYFHLPFCRTLCLFCACNVIWTKDQTRGDAYVDLLCREMDLVAQSISPGRKVTQLHWGGGTPTHSSAPVLERLFAGIRDRFAFDEDPEMGVELNPREMEPEHLEALARCGFKRASIGIQDFDPVVQAAVRRLQTESQTRSVVERCRALGFQSVNVDLIYGLPLQTVRSFEATIGSIVDLAPDRIALFNFAYLPQLIPHQRAIKAQMLPAPEVKLDILELAIERFTNAGYVYIGMDHFARPDDELTRALADRTLTRNFQGYTTKGGCDLLAFGVSGISQVGPCYAQNHKEYPSYQALIEGGKLPTERGILLSRDDELRWDVIRRLMCHFVVVKPEIELLYGIDFDDYFVDSLRSLESMASDALVELAPDRITVRPLGRLLVRNVAMAFDSYLPSAKQATFSRTV